MLYKILEPYLNRSAFIREFDELVASADNTYCSNLNQTAKALMLARMFNKHKQLKHLVFVAPDCNKAEEHYEDLVLLLGKESVSFLPDYETLPYEERSPHYSIRAKRLEVLERALSPQPLLLVASLKSLLRKIICPRVIEKNILVLGVNSEIDIDLLSSKLIGFGYEMQTEVSKVGDVSRRGGILDVYSPAQKYPVRLEFFGDTISSCRYFDPFTQVSTAEVTDTIKVIPAREVSLDDISSKIPSQWEKIHERGLYEGIEQDVSLLYQDTATIVEYLQGSLVCGQTADKASMPVIVYDEYDVLRKNADELVRETNELYIKKMESVKSSFKKGRAEDADNAGKVVPEPQMVFADFDELAAKSSNQHCFSALEEEKKSLHTHLRGIFVPQPVINRDVALLQDIIEQRLNDGWHVVIQSDNKPQSNRMREMLKEFSDRIQLEIGVLHRGFELPDAKLAIYTDHEIFNRYKQKKYQEYFPAGEALVDYESLKPGDYIVHIEHGIGLYEGLRLMTVNNSNIECLVIHYAGDAKVYVPTFQLKLVSKYISEDGIAPELHKIGGKRWEQSKRNAKKQIEMIADDLVKLYAERSVRQGIAFDPDPIWQTEMEESFIYEDTPDQRRATEEIKSDMESINPMERLLCGDVGFGKTEVAVRAAFKAVTSGYQVAVLVPTTLLAEQHYLVFRERLAQYPVNITMFSRFRTPAKIRKSLVEVQAGQVDIAIGTHRLLSKDVLFKRLGLLIVDEEHRFGVRHKEKIRKLKSNVDTLYMSATPIPRTLNMALVRLKEMSLIQTSPKARLPIRTNIIPFNINIIKDAIKRELDRGGQILFVHNRIETIESIAGKIKDALPGIRVVVGHGQLPEKQLEQIMLDFYDHKYDILVATTIIESGIDIANANTIFVNRADMFGLAQLYQIRGRVGRSNRRAYAYLIIPTHLQPLARKRLEALSEYNALGSGYQIAMRDLELRGAGTLLGTKQSGVINSVGFNYYNRMLSEAVDNLVNGKENIWKEDKELEKTHIDADFFFPADYIPDQKTRLDFYNRMLDFKEIEQFETITAELKDRFGDIPEPAVRGLMYFKIKMLTDKSSVESFRIQGAKVILRFNKKKLPAKKTLERLITSCDYPINFDDTKQSLLMTITLPESCSNDKEQVLMVSEKILLMLQEENGQ